MTDITKRLAEALREVSKRAKEWGTVGHMGIASIADSALAEYDRARPAPEDNMVREDGLSRWGRE